MEQLHTCKYCDKKFHKATTLTSHMCVKKRRYIDIDTAGSRIGFTAFRRFYELSAQSKSAKTKEDFIASPYYIDFAKFGNFLAVLKPVHLEQYIDFVIRHGVKLKDWTKDFVYELYIVDLLKKEPAASATDRTITEIMSWSEKNNIPFCEFFLKISPNEAVSIIRTGRLSPWVLYLATTSNTLMNKFTEDHMKFIGEMIDVGFWSRKLRKEVEDVDYIKSLLEQLGL
jgi:hypothetical protein